MLFYSLHPVYNFMHSEQKEHAPGLKQNHFLFSMYESTEIRTPGTAKIDFSVPVQKISLMLHSEI